MSSSCNFIHHSRQQSTFLFLKPNFLESPLTSFILLQITFDTPINVVASVFKIYPAISQTSTATTMAQATMISISHYCNNLQIIFLLLFLCLCFDRVAEVTLYNLNKIVPLLSSKHSKVSLSDCLNELQFREYVAAFKTNADAYVLVQNVIKPGEPRILLPTRKRWMNHRDHVLMGIRELGKQ